MRKGFTLPELLVALGILGLLFSISTISLLRSQRSFTQAALVDTILTDIRDQQNKAMSQDTQGEATNTNYGVYLSEESYTLFKGGVYNPNDDFNFEIALDRSLRFANIDLPGSSIIFESGSGKVSGFISSDNSFDVEDVTNSETINIAINRYGIPLE